MPASAALARPAPIEAASLSGSLEAETGAAATVEEDETVSLNAEATLERLLLPAFNAPEAGGDGLSAALDSFEVRNAMRAWVTTGQVPQRKYVVRWLLDRMWMRERAGRGVELVLGYAHAGGRPGRAQTIIWRRQ